MPVENSQNHVCILMATYNGEKFLAEQLQSIEDQTHKNWRVVISDDGSNDGTLAIAREFQNKWGNERLEIRQGPQQGFCQNFLSMACDTTIRADFYAFADQDDVWLSDKLERAVAYFHENQDCDLPNACGTRTQIVSETLKPLGLSPEFILPKSFRNALVQSIAGGNTIVFNRAAKTLLELAGRQQVASHDWWLYQLVKGAGGVFHLDLNASVLYRQHPGALVGGNQSFSAKIDRLMYVLNGRFKEWNNQNYVALTNVSHLFTKENQDTLKIYGTFRSAGFKDRVRLFEVCGLYRQTWRSTFSLWLATIINKV